MQYIKLVWCTGVHQKYSICNAMHPPVVMVTVSNSGIYIVAFKSRKVKVV